ncbi:unnamed protein product [Diatraea saccharalis]|uniref:Uncharacterized protein n=1 Tax=Diatraea saccharalis TaxID=40085 RepID=A0A9N9R738_9NEOP|nr:unnamed protein product [Diatraea saccharalis]
MQTSCGWMRHCSHVWDCFLWEEVKRRDVEEVQSLEDLTIKNNNAFSEVKSDTRVLNKLNINLMKCARLCLDKGGLHFEQILKYSDQFKIC